MSIGALAADALQGHFDVLRPTEVFVAVYLDSRLNLLAVEKLYVGSVSTAIVSTRDAVRTALMLNASGIVIAHTHPSGDPSPSREDIAFTRKFTEAAALFDVVLHDHIVFGYNADGRSRLTSFRERGLL